MPRILLIVTLLVTLCAVATIVAAAGAVHSLAHVHVQDGR